ncbi:MAG: hypothetical protein V1703_02950 [Candidatus Altiarchaeota archaeon]
MELPPDKAEKKSKLSADIARAQAEMEDEMQRLPLSVGGFKKFALRERRRNEISAQKIDPLKIEFDEITGPVRQYVPRKGASVNLSPGSVLKTVPDGLTLVARR